MPGNEVFQKKYRVRKSNTGTWWSNEKARGGTGISLPVFFIGLQQKLTQNRGYTVLG